MGGWEDAGSSEGRRAGGSQAGASFDGFGHPPDVAVGTVFPNRRALADSKVHRPLQAGICGTEKHGAESIVVSGGYEDDVDLGDEIIYTGQGGRDQNTGRQVDHQRLTRGNAALVTSMATGVPVRVVRGHGGDVRHSPTEGLRYDGLYRVDEYWSEVGVSDFRVWRYRLCAVVSPSREVNLSREVNAATVIGKMAPRGNPFPGRRATSVQRVVRSSRVADHVKALHDYTCQVCGTRLATPTGSYAEAAHIQGLGSPHHGPDVVSNVLCLCPNHHVLFDMGTMLIGNDGTVTVLGPQPETHRLREVPSHPVDREFLTYHREHHSTAW